MSAQRTDQASPLILYILTDAVSLRFLCGQLSQVEAAGFDVAVACGGDTKSNRDLIGQPQSIWHLPLVREPRLVDDVRALVAIIRLIRHLRPSAVNCSTPKAGLLGCLGAFLCRVPVRIYVVRGLRFETSRGIGRRVLTMADRCAARCATRLIFNSESLREVALSARLAGSREGVVLGAGSGNGIDVDRFGGANPRNDARAALGIGRNEQVLGFVGRLTRDKGVLDLASVFASLTRRRPALRLLIVGRTEDSEPATMTAIEALQKHPGVIWVGWTDSIERLYPAMDVLVFPSFREGLPNVPLEAQAAGVPVVGYAATGTRDAVRDGITGILVPVGDRAGLERALDAALESPASMVAMGATGTRWVRDSFDRELVWSALLQYYTKWLAEAGQIHEDSAKAQTISAPVPSSPTSTIDVDL